MFAKHKLLAIAAFAALCMLFGQVTMALAGTTGALSGTVTLQDGTPLSGATVTAISPSQTVSTVTNSSGHYAFVSLVPDTYRLTASKDNYDTVAQDGISVFADNTANANLKTQTSTRVLGHITTVSAAALVKPGTTADVYSVNATTAAKLGALGGGANADNAYSALASVPGVVAAPGQGGWNQLLHIRGGDYDQVGYEFDGVPVLRSYDNYPTGNASALGQQELQVYTGAAPANSEAQGLSGYINQVLRSGTYPGSATADFGIGGPALYNKANIEVGGASPDRNFAYFLGIGMYDAGFRAVDQKNGVSISQQFGTPFGLIASPSGCAPGDPANKNYASCYATGIGPGGYLLGGIQMGAVSHIADRENVLNLHFGIPHRNDAGKDEIQLLLDSSELYTTFYSSVGDWGGVGFTGGRYPWATGTVYTGQLDQPIGANFNQQYAPYAFPSQPGSLIAPGLIPINHQDGQSNGQGIFKLQYQHNIGSSAYFRVYGYSFYSDWLQNSPNSALQCCIGGPIDYELPNHTRGVSATFADQLNSNNLINVEASVIGSYNFRQNSGTIGSTGFPFAYLVASASPKNGICYQAPGSGTIAVPIACTGRANSATGPAAVRTGDQTLPVDPTTLTCGGGSCEFFAVENGYNGGGNLGRPVFTSAAITDQFKPSEKLMLNFGLRFDRYAYKGSDTNVAPNGTNQGSARDFWFNAWNQDECIAPALGSFAFRKAGDPSAPCPAGTSPAILINQPNFTESFNVLEPRFGGTYTYSPDTVIRFSYGKYAEAANAAYEQYNVMQQNLAGYDGARFFSYGFNSTSHAVRPEVSNNYDLSLEHHFKNSTASFKLTPFYRTTRDQIQSFFLDQRTNFVSGLNTGNQTAYGLELQLNAGDFSQNGVAAQLAYTYTSSKIRFTPFANGSSVITTINNGIVQYNQYTKFCATNFADARCGNLTAAPAHASACFTQAGAADPTCAALGTVGSPYYNANVQSLFDLNGSYNPFTVFPGTLASGAASYAVPHAVALILNFKHDKWAFTPSLQFQAGGRYGAPLSTGGIDPAAGCGALAASGNDPRYPGGVVPGGSPYDATTCNGQLTNGIPNPVTGQFDTLGAFKQPSQLLGNLQISYLASSRVTLVANLANLVDSCFGGDKQPWTTNDRRVCFYNQNGLSGSGFVHAGGSNFYNPGSTFQPYVQYPYVRGYSSLPFQGALELQVKM